MWDLVWIAPVGFLAEHFKSWGLGFLSEPMAGGAILGIYWQVFISLFNKERNEKHLDDIKKIQARLDEIKALDK